MVIIQQNLFSVEDDTVTQSTDWNLYTSQITGDLGEIEFDKFCTQNNISYYKASSGAAAIDRIIITKSGLTVKVHIKAAVRQAANKYNSSRFQFQTRSSTVNADYYFCTGFKENHEKLFSIWIPFKLAQNKQLNISETCLWKYAEYQKIPSEIMDASNILPFQ